MPNNRRETLLKIAVGIAVGLFLLDWAIVSPAMARWKAQSERIADLSAKVKRGRQLLEREHSIRARWAEMLRTDLPEDPSSSENDVFKAIGRWTRESRLGFSNLTQQWRTHEEGFDTLELRTTASGDQASLARLLYEIEVDPLPAHVEECEIAARDAQGRQLTMTARLSFMRLTGTGRSSR